MRSMVRAKLQYVTTQGTVLRVLIPNQFLKEQLSKYSDGDVLIGELRLDDGRTIRADQRKKAWATLGDIALWNGDDREVNHWHLKHMYMSQSDEDYFSLSDCSVTTARHYITFLLDFCLQWDVPLTEPIADRTDDIGAMLYSALIRRKCVLCGSSADCHHVEAIGMGRSRLDVVHLGMLVMALCRECHGKAHTMGRVTFEAKYHVYGIAADEKICEVYKLNI